MLGEPRDHRGVTEGGWVEKINKKKKCSPWGGRKTKTVLTRYPHGWGKKKKRGGLRIGGGGGGEGLEIPYRHCPTNGNEKTRSSRVKMCQGRRNEKVKKPWGRV